MVMEMKIVQPLNLKLKSLNQIFVTGDITATDGDANTRAAFKNWAPFTKRITHINDEHIGDANNLDIMIPMYNLIII